MGEFLGVGYSVIDKINGRELFGGAASGMAINGRFLNLNTGLLTLFGGDKKSREYYYYLAEIGVNLTQSRIYNDASIPINEISHIDRTLGWHDGGISKYINSIPIDAKAINSYNVVHLASAHFNLANRVAENKHGQGVLSYSPGPKLGIDHRYLDQYVLRRSEILFLNEKEWEQSKKILRVDKPGGIIEKGPKVIVTTYGKDGSIISYKKGNRLVESHIIPHQRNNKETTGAGDAFALGFILGYINHLPIRSCGELGADLAEKALKNSGVIIYHRYSK